MNTSEPFFSQFIEAQELTEEETDQVSGGQRALPPIRTSKLRDCDDWGYVTMKAPSDDDEDHYVTMKYPSDNDEGGFSI